jgi:hypothetical protein
MPSGTTYDPQNMRDFEKVKLFKDAKGVSGTATAGTTTNLDLALTDDILLAGGSIFLAQGAAAGDKVDFQVLAGGNVIAQFISDWYVDPSTVVQQVPQSNYPAKLFAGMVLRVAYHSVGTSDVWIAVNYNREKVLV